MSQQTKPIFLRPNLTQPSIPLPPTLSRLPEPPCIDSTVPSLTANHMTEQYAERSYYTPILSEETDYLVSISKLVLAVPPVHNTELTTSLGGPSTCHSNSIVASALTTEHITVPVNDPPTGPITADNVEFATPFDSSLTNITDKINDEMFGGLSDIKKRLTADIEQVNALTAAYTAAQSQ